MRPPREQYARAWSALHGIEVHVGLEYTNFEEPEDLSYELRDLITAALYEHPPYDPVSHLVEVLSAYVLERWPDRAYFIETDSDGCGVQVFQPFGLPKNTEIQ